MLPTSESSPHTHSSHHKWKLLGSVKPALRSLPLLARERKRDHQSDTVTSCHTEYSMCICYTCGFGGSPPPPPVRGSTAYSTNKKLLGAERIKRLVLATTSCGLLSSRGPPTKLQGASTTRAGAYTVTARSHTSPVRDEPRDRYHTIYKRDRRERTHSRGAGLYICVIHSEMSKWSVVYKR